jgi:hypothetical protein
MIQKNIGRLLLIVIFLMASSWGFLVHRTTQQLAIYQLPQPLQQFFFAHMDYLVKNATRPDERRNTDSTEATKHFIDAEAFGTNALKTMPKSWDKAVAKYSADTLLKYGYVTYHVMNLLDKLTIAFKNNNEKDILFYAADIGHYIQDAHVPLHTTLNYDGQLTNQNGIHALWESVVPELEITNYNLYTKKTATYLHNPTKAIWKAAQNANNLLPNVLVVEKSISLQFTDSTKYRIQIRRGKPVKYYTTAFAKAYGAALAPTINKQLLLSSQLTASFWYTAWVNAGKPNMQSPFIANNDSILLQHLQFYKSNSLLKNGFLIAKKNATNGSNNE